MSSEPVSEQIGNPLFLSASDCAGHCARDPACLQYSFGNGKCLISKSIIKGVPKSGVHSGWMPYRIQTYLKYMIPCGRVDYVLEWNESYLCPRLPLSLLFSLSSLFILFWSLIELSSYATAVCIYKFCIGLGRMILLCRFLVVLGNWFAWDFRFTYVLKISCVVL